VSRIIGGVAGGRRLSMPKGQATRPTSDRVREGLFSSLGGDLSGRAFLDLYAGSGAVGLEAASRGASTVVMVERDARAVAAIRSNAAAVALPNVAVRAESVARFLAEPVVTTFDVVFLDPPYADPVADVLGRLVDGEWLAADGVVVVERATRDDAPPWPPGLVQDRSRRYGDSTLWYGRRP
jgi:16S rRNA (guanine966-N2)-methyltransferase